MTSRLVQRCCLVGVALLFANSVAAQSRPTDVGQEVAALRNFLFDESLDERHVVSGWLLNIPQLRMGLRRHGDDEGLCSYDLW